MNEICVCICTFRREAMLGALLREHVAGTHNHTEALHQALSIELIHRQLLERSWERA